MFFMAIIPQSFAHENITEECSANDMIQSDILDAPVEDKDMRGADYYFNSSSDSDGDGSKINPYKYIDDTRIGYSSTIHLAKGEYNLSNDKTVNGVTIIGENPENTILKYSGEYETGILSVSSGRTFIVENITLIGFNIEVSGGTFYARNTIIKDTVAIPTYSEATDIVNSATNSFGGAIIAYKSESIMPTVTLVNCTLTNNTAEYGGAIYITGGNLNIRKTKFDSNYAYNYGGAIAALYSSVVTIEESIFTNHFSINDAGGAIYLLNSQMTSSNSQIYNSTSTFGAAITSLNSKIILNKFRAENNTATYEGGAVYAIYNSITCIESTFKNNHARNGGAIYGDDLKLFELENNHFISNVALQYAGAVFSMLNVEDKVFYNVYEDNHAQVENDFYQSNFTFVLDSDGNYTLYYSDYDYYGFIPSSYDLREYNMVSPVKDQQSGGNCWAFASIAALESAILKTSGELFDLSEGNMKNMMQKYSNYGWNVVETNAGGNDGMSIGYLVNWLGPVLEYDDYYDDYSMLSPLLNPVTHVQNIMYLKRDSYTDNDAIKQAVMKYGAVATGIYFSSFSFNENTNAYYFSGQSYANHAVTIVGWDDYYPKENFFATPEADGAWIVKNSWDSTWGEDGYFYVSYYDNVFAEVGVPDASYVFVFNDTAKYDKNYQYDYIGKTDYFVTGRNTIWVENIFNATDYDMLAGVSTYFRKTTDWDLFIIVNDEIKMEKSGTCNPGYVTINLGEYIPLQPNDTFRIRFKFDNKNGAEFAISEGIYANKQLNTSGFSFFSKDGVEWIDLYDYEYVTLLNEGHKYTSQVAAIKAFTISYELQHTVFLDVKNNFNKVNVTAFITDQFNNIIEYGNLTFHIGGKDIPVTIKNGVANLNYVFADKGVFDINASYKNGISQYRINITVIDADIDVKMIEDKNNVKIIFSSPYGINSTLNITINDENYTVYLKNGEGVLDLKDLLYGKYTFMAYLIDDYYGSSYYSNFDILINKTKLIADDLTVYSKGNVSYSVLLKDIYDNPIVNRQVYFIVNGRQYIGITNFEGKATIIAKLNDIAKYSIQINFYGDDNYFNISDNKNIDVKSSVLSSSQLHNGNYEAVLLNQNGVPLSGEVVNVNFNGKDYKLTTDTFGRVSLKLNNLEANKNYQVTVSNPKTKEYFKGAVKITGLIGNNLNMYYNAGRYGVKVNDVGSGEIVKFKIGSKVFYSETNNRGYAYLKITLKPGKYKITAFYGGLKVSNKIVVKKVLFTKNISKKKSKKITFKATLKHGKKVLSKKKISFKVNGKKYVVKTNKKGIAKVTLKKLKVGKNRIYTSFGDLTVKNTILITN